MKTYLIFIFLNIFHQNLITLSAGKVEPNCLFKATVDKTIKYRACMGVPYAVPPIGPLRFQASTIIQGWNASMDYSFEKQNCYGMNFQGAEDCLYLNIYTPLQNNKTLKPVLVWIPGEKFSDIELNTVGPDYILNEGITFVSIQYRMGFFGFASTLDLAATGNYGLKDILCALNWIKENIQSFGGDPNQVTLIGHAAGAASISILQLSPLSKGLFHGVILQSGTALVPWSRAPKARSFTFDVARSLKLTVGNSTIMIKQLRDVPAEKLQDVVIKTFKTFEGRHNPFWGSILGPVPENNSHEGILRLKAHESLLSGHYVQVPALIGFPTIEGMRETYSALIQAILKMPISDFYPISLSATARASIKIIGEKVKKHFTSNRQPSPNLAFIAETLYIKPIVETARQMANRSKVFLYELEKTERTFDLSPEMQKIGYELAFLFKKIEDTSEIPAHDVTRQNMIKFITNFIKYGDPTPTKTVSNFTWLPTNYIQDAIIYASIDDSCTLKSNPFEDTRKFYQELYFKYANNLDTY